MKNKIAILHHGSDMDGIFSGLYAKKLFYSDCEFTLIPVEYGDAFDESLLESHDVIVIADFSYDPETMLKIWEAKDGNFYWYDHHYKAIEDSVTHGYNNINGIRMDGISAVKLVSVSCNIIDSKFIELLNIYDIHDVSDPDEYIRAKNLNYYLLSCSREELENNRESVDVMVAIGNRIRLYAIEQAKKMKPILMEISGEYFHAYNGYSSDLLGVSEQERIAMFTVSTEHVTFSLRSKESDVSKIAIAMGGGGHKQACGFKVPVNHLHGMML